MVFWDAAALVTAGFELDRRNIEGKKSRTGCPKPVRRSKRKVLEADIRSNRVRAAYGVVGPRRHP